MKECFDKAMAPDMIRLTSYLLKSSDVACRHHKFYFPYFTIPTSKHEVIEIGSMVCAFFEVCDLSLICGFLFYL